MLFSALEQTHHTCVVCDSEWLTVSFYSMFLLNIHRSSVLTVLFGCSMAGATWNCCCLGSGSVYAIQPCTVHSLITTSCRVARVKIEEVRQWLKDRCCSAFSTDIIFVAGRPNNDYTLLNATSQEAKDKWVSGFCLHFFCIALFSHSYRISIDCFWFLLQY